MLKHPQRSIVIASLCLGLFGSLAQAADANKTLEAANAAYDQGKCDKAITLYSEIRDSKGISEENRDVVTFRRGYCAYNLGNLELAKSEFLEVLKKYPDEDEARLRYAEVLFADEDFHGTIANSKRIRDPNLAKEARILMARAYIEIQEARSALLVLKKLDDKDPNLAPIIGFWRGVAYFQLFEYTAAENEFRRTMNASSPDLWTRTAAENWLSTVDDSQNWVHPRLGVTYGYDDNIGQYTYKSSATASPDKSYYVGDGFLAYDLYVSSRPFHVDKATIIPSLSTYIQKYNNSGNQSYNYTSTGADVTATIPADFRWTTRAGVSFSDAKYNNVFYHNYLGANGAIIYGISKTMSAYASASVSKAVGGNESTTFGPSVGINGDATDFYWLGNLSYSSTNGVKAVYTTSGTTTSVTSGSTFSSYQSTSIKAGIGTILPFEFDLLGTVLLTNTTYGKEDVPSGAAFSTSQRTDSSWTAQVNLSRSIIARRMTFIASYSYTNNTSNGYQGLSYTNGYSPDYNITRSLVSANLSYGF